MRVLLTNNALAGRAGSELYLRDVAVALLDRGHQPVVFSPSLGEVAEELRRATVPVVDDLARIGAAPDLIHGQHHLETAQALLHFPGVPAVQVCHGWLPWVEAPLRHPRILRWVAVDATVRERLVLENGIPEERTVTMLNFVDLARFRPRQPLPARPRRALVFSNASGDRWVRAAASACRTAGIEIDVVGRGSGRSVADPERLLGDYDLVFAKARAALEAMACGCAVVLCDRAGAGPLVTLAGFDELRRSNFGIRTLRQPVAPQWLASQLARYDSADAAAVSARLRETASRDGAVDALLGVYQEVLDEYAAAEPASPLAEGRAMAAYLASLAPVLKKTHSLSRRQRSKLSAWVQRLGSA